MVKSVDGCRLPHWEDARYKHEEIDPNAPTDVVKKINLLHDRWNSLTGMTPTNPAKSVSDEANVKFWTRLQKVGDIVEATRYSKNLRRSIENRAIGAWSKLVKLGKEATNLTKQQLVEFQRRARGAVTDAFIQLEVGKYADDLHRTMIRLTPNLTEHQRSVVMWDAIELGTQPYLVNTTPELNEPAKYWLDIRKEKAFQRAQEWGVNPEQWREIVGKSKLMVQALNEIPSLMSEFGIDINVLKNLGYMERVFTREAQEVIDIINNGGLFKVEPKMLERSEGTLKSFQKSRKFFDYIPEDSEVLQYLFERSDLFNKINKKLESDKTFKSLVGKDTVHTIDDLMGDGEEPILLHGIINELDEDDVNFLVESGFVHKIPWETSRVHQWMIKKYQLPFEGLNEIYVSDPRRAVRLYQQQLESLAGQSGKFWGTVRGAIQDGWGVSRDLIPNKEFVPLREAFPPSLIDNFGGRSDDLQYFLDETFIPTRVAETIKADYTITTSPFWTGVLGQTLMIFKKWSTGLILGSPAWFGRQVIGWTGTLFAQGGGGSALRYLQHLQMYAFAKGKQVVDKASNMNYRDYLDNTKYLYAGGTMTQRDLWDLAVRKGMIQDFNILGEQKQVNNRSLSRIIREFNWYNKNYPSAPKGKAVTNIVSDYTDQLPLFQFLGWGNTITDNFGKFSFLESVLRDKSLPLGTPKFGTNVDDAIQYVYDNTWSFDSVPVKDPLAQMLVPFINWRLKNFQQAAAFITEHPHKFASFLYLMGKPSEEAHENSPMEWSIIKDGWITEKDFPMIWEVDAESSGTGRREYFTYPLTNLLPYVSPIGDLGNILDVLGVFNKGEPLHRRNDIPKEMRDPYKKRTTALRRLVKEETMPWFEWALGMVNQEDNWGQSFEYLREKSKKRSLYGIEVDPVLYWSIQTLAPALKAPERFLSHTGLFGRAPYLDPLTGQYTEGESSVFGTTPDYQTNAQKPRLLSPSLGAVSDALGFAPYHHDIWWSQGYTTNEVKGLVSNGKKWLKQSLVKLASKPTLEEQNEFREKINEVMTFTFWAEVELAYLEKWRLDNGLPTHKALKIIEQQNRSVSDLLTEEEKQVIREEIWNKYKEYQ